MTKKSVTALLLVITMLMPMFVFNVAYAADIKEWKIEWLGNCKGSAELDLKEKYKGNSSLRVINESPDTGNVYVMFTQNVDVEAGKSYYVGGKLKASGASTIHFVVNWEKRYDPTSFGKTFDWTNVEFLYQANATKTVTFRVVISGVCETAWFDDCKFEDIATGENLLLNPGFESGNASVQNNNKNNMNDDGATEAYNKIVSSESFSENDITKANGALKGVSVSPANGAIKIDGNTDDWETFDALNMPVHSGQYTVYADDGKELDNKAKYKFAHDDSYFYLLAEITDNEHVYYEGSGKYWQGDSLQMALGDIASTYGTEIGVAYNPETEKCDIYGVSRTDSRAVLNAGRREGNTTVYEIAFPWECWFSQAVEEVYVSIGMNDNDGGTRRYCMELAPGIAEGKTNDKFPKFVMLSEKSDWYGWVSGITRKGYTNTEYPFEYYIVNSSDAEKKFNVTLLDETFEVIIPGHSGVRKSFVQTFDAMATHYPAVNVECDGVKKELRDKFVTERELPSKEYALEVVNKIKTYEATIKKLLDKCENKGISTDYEMVGYRTIEKYTSFTNVDINNNYLDRIYYIEESIDKIYNDVKTRLESYLDGRAEPIEVPRYMGGANEEESVSLFAENMMPDGSVEKRPTFYTGSAHGGYTRSDVPVFDDFGFNAQEIELPLNQALSYISGWGYSVFGNPKGSIKTEKDIKRSGERSMKITYESPLVSNQYYRIDCPIDVEPNTTYTLRGYIKGENSHGMNISMNGWNALKKSPEGTHDWTEYTASYTTTATQKTLSLMFIIENSGIIYLDDFEVINDETGENVMYNGDFEDATDGDVPVFDPHSSAVRTYVKRIEECDNANLAVAALLGTHYFFSDIIATYDIAHNGSGFLPYNVNADVARKMVENYIRGIIPMIKDFDNIVTVEVSNEPQMWFDKCGDFYREDWIKHLQERYVTIEALNVSYGTSYNSFSDVPMEAKWDNPAAIYDYNDFNNRVYAQFHNWAADIVHEIWPEAKVGAKIMPYVSNVQDRNRLNCGTNLEYYDSFDANVCDAWDYRGDAKLELVAEMWYDYLQSVKDIPVYNTEDHIFQDGNSKFGEEYAQHGARSIFMGGVHGRAFSVQWIWGYQFPVGGQVWGNIMFRPDAMYKIGHVGLDLNRLSQEITAIQNEPVDVGIICSNASLYAQPEANHAMYRAYESAVMNGKKAKFIVDSKPFDVHKYKLVIVPYAKYVKAETIEELRKYIANGGNVLIMGEESLDLNERNLANNEEAVRYIKSNSKVIGYVGKGSAMTSPTVEELSTVIRDELKALSLDYTQVIDAKTGEVAQMVEHNVAVCDGKLIINICNFGEEKELKVLVNGDVVKTAVNRITETDVNEVITLGTDEYVILEANIGNPFFDTYNHWSEEEVSALYGKGLVKGISPSRFNPQANITRAEFLALVNRVSDFKDVEYKGSIADVEAKKWYADTVQAALNAGIITNGNFRPDNAITREEMCVILISAYEKLNGTLTEYDEADFNDNDEISNLAVVSKAASLGLVKGMDDGNFAPKGNATRAEASAVINRFDNLKIGE